MADNTILLAVIAILNGAYLIGQKNQRSNFKEISAKLEAWVIAFTKLKAEHDANFADKPAAKTPHPILKKK
jgi:hypothetical protein